MAKYNVIEAIFSSSCVSLHIFSINFTNFLLFSSVLENLSLTSSPQMIFPLSKSTTKWSLIFIFLLLYSGLYESFIPITLV